MSFTYTTAQRQAIENRGGALLVSAAAGSGKTRVLTQRLLDYVTDPTAPRDVDQFLVITFTRAAAAELRTRIMDALAEQAAANPLDTRLRRQQSLCCRAPICTIHSLCADILREYAQVLALSPAFELLDEDRAAQLKQTTAERLLERRYETIGDDPSFRALVDSVGAGRDDRRLQSALLELYEKLRSHPDPAAWAAAQREALHARDATDAGETPWGRALLDDARRQAAYWARAMEAAVAEIDAADEKLKKAYGESFSTTAAGLRALCRALEQGWDQARAACGVEFPRIGGLRNYPDPDFAGRLKATRDACKSACAAFAELFAQDSAAQLRDLRAAAPAMEALLALALDFDRAYAGEKTRRGVLDFSDLEHETLRLLVDRESGGPSQVARELSRRYTEIMVDEYQDVNAVQELIFRALSRDGENLFLVGDVKQSIYRFRLAEPGLFLEKYETFAPADTAAAGQPRRVLLQENFRSRKPILEAVNRVFGCIMSRELGELDYDEDAALRYGAQGYDPALDAPVELHIIDGSAGGGDGEETAETAALEAGFVARKILELMHAGTPVTENGVTRPCRWDDFVLLLRSPGGKGSVFHQVLQEAGIPVESRASGGFFTSLEVSVTIDLLSVIDNPHADVPLISVLRSPAFGFTADQLSAIRTADRSSDFYGALRAAAAAGDEKSADFLSRLEGWRALAPELGLDALVWRLCNDTGLFAICAAMRDGARRRQNLMHLFEYARSFNQSGYRGVFRFVQWLRRMAERGQEPVSAAAGQAVRILSIHKSKGLEFPFVFLCDLAHRFNKSDASAPVLMHTCLGLGPKLVDPDRGLEYPTIARRAVAQQLTGELLSEEMRVLYVGMTRAKERLFLSCVWKKPQETLDKLALAFPTPPAPAQLRSATDFSRWLAVAARWAPDVLPLSIHGPSEAAEAAAEPLRPAPDGEAVEAALAALRERLDFVYPWAGAAELPSKLTATELKGAGEEDADAQYLAGTAAEDYSFRRPDPDAPRALNAAQRGTAMHSFLQYVDFARAASAEGLAGEADRLREQGFLKPEEAKVLDLKALARFFASPVGRRLRAAKAPLREFRFQLLAEASAYFPTAGQGDELLLQGVVDCCFAEDGGLTVLDYKTDHVTAAQVPERAERYRGQLTAYAGALERIFGLPVKQCILWFLHCGTEHILDI